MTFEKLTTLKPMLAIKAQNVYDEWEQDEQDCVEELGYGGICQDIAEAMASLLNEEGIEAVTVSNHIGEQHVYVVCKIRFERSSNYCDFLSINPSAGCVYG